MILNILSDLHLSLGALKLPENHADLVILAGDIARPKEAASWASGFAKPVLYVPGNHEFYGGSIAGTVKELRQLCAATNIHVLDKNQIIVDGVAPYVRFQQDSRRRRVGSTVQPRRFRGAIQDPGRMARDEAT